MMVYFEVDDSDDDEGDDEDNKRCRHDPAREGLVQKLVNIGAPEKLAQ